MKRIIGYARVSTDEQAFNSHALEQQIARLKQEGATEILCDIDSGDKNDRKDFKKLLELIANNEGDEIIATRWDRLTRNEEGYIALKKLLKNSSVTLRLLDVGIVDLSTANGELTSDIQSIMAVNERRQLRERILHGNKHRRTRNAAASHTPFGYNNVLEKYQLDRRPLICLVAERPDNYLELSQEVDLNRLPSLSKADVARDMIETLLSLRYIKKTINHIYEKYGLVPIPGQQASRFEGLVAPRSTTHFKEWITNPVLQGHTAYLKYAKNHALKPQEEWDIRKNTHPKEALISPTELEEILDIFALNRKESGNPKRTSYLTHTVFCAHCGHKCTFKTSHNWKYKYYGCRYSKQGCPNHKNLSLYEIEEAIIQRIFSYAHFLYEQGDNVLDFSNSEELAKLQAQLFGLEAIPDFESTPSLRDAREDLRHKIASLTQSLKNNVFSDGTAQQIIRHPYARNLTFWYALTESERSQIYYKLVNKVVISHEFATSVHLKV
ncbi:MAG: fdxN element excision recombinase XisF [Snowella sp.]|nr:fdxN element excision recombinase XisF [Snowella sp.]